jgi:hypothetical protein
LFPTSFSSSPCLLSIYFILLHYSTPPPCSNIISILCIQWTKCLQSVLFSYSFLLHDFSLALPLISFSSSTSWTILF